MQLRPTTESDLDRVTSVTVDEPVGWIEADRYLEELKEGMYRPEWTWIAEQDGRVLARALWWGHATGEHPLALDCLYVDPSVEDRAALGAELVRAACGPSPSSPAFWAARLFGLPRSPEQPGSRCSAPGPFRLRRPAGRRARCASRHPAWGRPGTGGARPSSG